MLRGLLIVSFVMPFLADAVEKVEVLCTTIYPWLQLDGSRQILSAAKISGTWVQVRLCNGMWPAWVFDLGVSSHEAIRILRHYQNLCTATYGPMYKFVQPQNVNWMFGSSDGKLFGSLLYDNNWGSPYRDPFSNLNEDSAKIGGMTTIATLESTGCAKEVLSNEK